MSQYQAGVNAEPPQPKPKKSGCFRLFVDVLETLLLSVILFVGINTITARIRVDGDSMDPTLLSGEYLIVNRLSYRFANPQRGDIIVFYPPPHPDEEYIKRVIGLPGDQVEVKGGHVYVNGQLLDEPYLQARTDTPGIWKVPAGQLFVLGDNRDNSSDSREWGTVAMDKVVGKAVLVYWPPLDWGLVGHVSLATTIH